MNNNDRDLAKYTEEAYLLYSMSVVGNRAIPHLKDGQKPVQRRILYAMKELNLLNDKNFKKSARIVGDIIGKYHPHGDTSVYEAMVKMSQDFYMRYPLVHGQGNFGSIDGDSAAAMRYTEAKFMPIAELLLSELNITKTKFNGNFDNTLTEPSMLPSRLPFILLNGTFGIAVGMGTKIPSHNIRNVSDAVILMIKNEKSTVEDIVEVLKGPDLPNGGQIITPKKDIIKAYENGSGAFTVRCKWFVEELPRKRYQIVINELPPELKPSDIIETIGNLERPKVAKDKKPTKTQIQQKQFILNTISKANDESSAQEGIRVIIEPKNPKDSPEEIMNSLYKLLGLEVNFNMNMNLIGENGRAENKNIKDVLKEWIDFRFITVTNRTEHLKEEVDKKIHLLEGKEIVYHNLRDVIDLIQDSEDPKTDLINKYNLSELQVNNILDIKLRQLSKMELDKILFDLEKFRKESEYLQSLLVSKTKMKNLIIKEIETDTKNHEDERKTLIKEEEKAIIANNDVMVVDEKITFIYTKLGWMTTRKGHDFDMSSFQVKDGDEVQMIIELRTIDTLAILAIDGRVLNIKPSMVDGGKNMVHINTFLDLEPSNTIIDIICINNNDKYLISSNSGYGFITDAENLYTKNKAGKKFLTVSSDDNPNKFTPILDNQFITCVSSDNRCLSFKLEEINTLPKGKGVKLIQIPKDEKMINLFIHNDTDISLNLNSKEYKVDINEGILSSRARRGKIVK